MMNTRITVVIVSGSVICFTLGAVVSIVLFVDSPESRIGLITAILATMPANLAGLRALIVADKVDDKTDRILNGEMDKKIKDNVRQVIEHRWGPIPRSRPENPSEKDS